MNPNHNLDMIKESSIRTQALDTGQSLTSPEFSNAPNVSTTTAPKRMSITLSGDAARLLVFLAESQGITQNEALRKAIATEAYLFEARQQGSKVLLQKPDNQVREVLFR